MTQRENNSDTIRVMGIYNDSVVDGTGLRDVIFVNMCPHQCDSCHNPESWDYKNGKNMAFKDIYKQLSPCNNLTLSGGEPMLQASKIALFISQFNDVKDKNIWVYSGYTFEEIINDPDKKELLELCDVLVDGKFELDKFTMGLKFKGSSNQRVIDIKESLNKNKVVELEL